MIKLKVEDYCQNCPEFEANVNKVVFPLKNVLYNTTISCEHKERCGAIKKYLEEERANDD